MGKKKEIWERRKRYGKEERDKRKGESERVRVREREGKEEVIGDIGKRELNK